jgi:two-component system, OmpR family, sensor histidine kinase KdpD
VGEWESGEWGTRGRGDAESGERAGMGSVKQVQGRKKEAPGIGRVVLSAIASVGGITGLLHLFPAAAHVATAPMLYLLAVFGIALVFGSGAAVFASLLAFFAIDWFLVEPRYTFHVRDPAEWLALVMFLVTAIVTGQLTAMLRSRAEEARQRERETAALAEASWAVASQVDRGQALAEVMRRLIEVVHPEAAAILARDGEQAAHILVREGAVPGLLPDFSAGSEGRLLRLVLEEGRSVGWSRKGHPQGQSPGEDAAAGFYLPLAIEDRVLGALYLRLAEGRQPSEQERRVVESLAAQAAVVLERDRLMRTETHAQALAEADRLKTALLSMISHDFRSPLTGIKASVTALLQEGAPLNTQTQRELLQGIDGETDRLNRIVGNLLALSRLDADAWKPQGEPTAVQEVIGSALSSFNAAANERVRVRIEPGLPEVWLDPVQMTQVLYNLIDNALKYSPPETPVEVRCCVEGTEVALEVLDRGSGLPAGEEESVFDRFYRAPGFRESAIPGVGIGLAVCRGLVEAHAGTLTAHPRGGGGARFRIALPLREEDSG